MRPVKCVGQVGSPSVARRIRDKAPSDSQVFMEVFGVCALVALLLIIAGVG